VKDVLAIDKIPELVKERVKGLPETTALYYDDPYLRKFDARVLRVIDSNELCYIVLDSSCFFPEGGGQLGDMGFITRSSDKFRVVDTQIFEGVATHFAFSDGKKISEGESVTGIIDWSKRYERMKQHTASHILFSAIKTVLKIEDLMYMGVQVRDDTSRIDISYGKSIPIDQLHEIEKLSNKICLENKTVNIWHTTRDDIESKYGNQIGLTEKTPYGRVRVVEIEDWDIALCSGTHVKSTVEIGLISVLDRFRLKKGVERIEFTAGKHAYQGYENNMKTLSDTAQVLKTSVGEVPRRLNHLLKERDDLKKELNAIKNELVEIKAYQLENNIINIGNFRFLNEKLSNVDAQSLKRIALKLVRRDPYLIVILGSDTRKMAFIVGALGDETVKCEINMADIISKAARIIQGGGGGNPQLAQAGGKDLDHLEEALQLCTKLVYKQFSH
jgi:alanyl-tRNA synthetase